MSVTSSDPPKSLKQLFVPPVADICTRCSQRVYQVEKIGPVNQVIFHKHCFKCVTCGQHLNLKTYFTNPGDYSDEEIYCSKDYPRVSALGFDARAIGIKAAMSAPSKGAQANDLIRGSGDAPRIGADAMDIRQAMWVQSEFGKKYLRYNKHHFPALNLINKTKEKLMKYQTELEQRQREEEDRLMEAFHNERKHEAQNMEKEINDEWEDNLKELMNKYDSKAEKSGKDSVYDKEVDALRKNMTTKLATQKEALTVKLQTKAQQETSDMVKKHSQQMLDLLQSKQEELKKELEEEIKASTNEELLADDPEILEEVLTAIALPAERPDAHAPKIRKRDIYHDPSVFTELDEDVFKVAETEQCSFTELVSQLTAHCLSDLQKARAIFRWLTVKDLNVMEFDEATNEQDTPLGLLRGIKHGTETYHTLFMRLCSYAGLACQEVKGHSKSVGYEPGMKIREDTFLNTWNAVLIMGDWWPVQCNWGARHLVLNKDPNERKEIRDKRTLDKIRYEYDEHYFLTDPDEFIQEFWAQDPKWQLLERPVTLEEFEAMPFVRSVFFHHCLEFAEPMKAVLFTDNKGGAEMKLLLPADSSSDLVFHYHLRFADRERRHDTQYKGSAIERYVFHTMSDGWALFSVHVPIPAAYFLEIFANKIDSSNKIGADPSTSMQPFKLKCATKLKIVCTELVGKMHPLPNCAPGEWGPMKSKRHFGILPLTHPVGVINVEDGFDMRFQLPRQLRVVGKLHLNGTDSRALDRFVSVSVDDGRMAIIKVTMPQPGQFGLDIYARPDDAANQSLAHACKYLINCTNVTNPVQLPPAGTTSPPAQNNNKEGTQQNSSSSNTGPADIGPLPEFEKLGLKTISHKTPIVDKVDKNGSLTIEIGTAGDLKLTHQLIREPDEDWSHKVSSKESGKKCKFSIVLPKNGTYRLKILAGKRDEPQNKAIPVFNYVIPFNVEDPTLQKKKKGGLFRSSSINS